MVGRADSQPQAMLLTINEACALLRISRWSLYRLFQTRSLESVYIGRRRFVPAAAIDAFLTSLKTGERA